MPNPVSMPVVAAAVPHCSLSSHDEEEANRLGVPSFGAKRICRRALEEKKRRKNRKKYNA
ncbi:hypothetical protein IF2G_07787 [Cordyceps javanica]|nr:hypothetical protein IF2G_07787 [Cordyceps javanica]